MDFSIFKTDSWQMLNNDEKRSALQELEHTAAEAQSRSERYIEGDDSLGDRVLGVYNPMTPEYLFINGDLLNSAEPGAQYKMMKTVLHEGRHAYQDDRVNGRITGNAYSEQSELWEKNYENGVYIDPQNQSDASLFFPTRNSWEAYYTQPIEDDAEGYATACMNNLSDVFSDDPHYGVYLGEMNDTRQQALERASDILGDDPQEAVSDLVDQRYEDKHADDPQPYKARSNNYGSQSLENELHYNEMIGDTNSYSAYDAHSALDENKPSSHLELYDDELSPNDRQNTDNYDYLYSNQPAGSGGEENTDKYDYLNSDQPGKSNSEEDLNTQQQTEENTL